MQGAGASGVVALCVADAEGVEEGEGLVVLDEFGDGVGAESVGDVDDGFDDELVGGCLGESFDEFAVDFEEVEFEVFEVVEGREAGAEVVEREVAAVLAEGVGELLGVFDVRDCGGFGEFDDEPAGGDGAGV